MNVNEFFYRAKNDLFMNNLNTYIPTCLLVIHTNKQME